MVTTQTQPPRPSSHVREREGLEVNINWAKSFLGHEHSGGVWIVAELFKTLCGAEANLRRVGSSNLSQPQSMILKHSGGNETIDISFTSMGSEDFPPTDRVVATLGKFIACKNGEIELVNNYRPIQVKRDNGGHNTVPHWLGAQASNTGVQVAE